MKTNEKKVSDLTLADLESFLDKERNKKGRLQKDLEATRDFAVMGSLCWGLLVGAFLIYSAYFS